MDIPVENTGGDCFVEAVNNAMADKSLYVVHGIVHGQGALEGLVFPHAWNETEDGEYVIDTSNGHDIFMPSIAYYAIGRIDPADVCKYDNEQMMQEVVRTGTYGPWDDMFDFDYRAKESERHMAIRTAISVDANELMEFIKRATRKWARRRFGDEPGDEFVDNHVSFETWHHEDGYMVFEVRGEWDYDGAYSLVYDYLNPTVDCFLCSNKYYFKTPTINVLQLFIPDEKMGKEPRASRRSNRKRIAGAIEEDDGLSYEGLTHGLVPSGSVFGDGFYQSVRDWALNDDWIANRQLFLGCPDDVTFADVWKAILSGRDVYGLLGIGELDVLERDLVFERLAEIGEIDVGVIYDAWNAGRGWRW